MSEIRVKPDESLDNALRRFKRSCAKAGVIQEVKKREHYVSPSLKRKQKSDTAGCGCYCPRPWSKTAPPRYCSSADSRRGCSRFS